MTKTYAALRLLEHGPLTGPQFRQITGWNADMCQWVLSYLRKKGRVKLKRRGGGEYRSLYELA